VHAHLESLGFEERALMGVWRKAVKLKREGLIPRTCCPHEGVTRGKKPQGKQSGGSSHKPEKKAATLDEDVSDEVEDHGGEDFLLDSNVIYSGDTDTYITFIPNAPKPIVLSGDTHRAICRAYSNFDGSPATVNEISRTFKIPRPWVMTYLRAHGITHDLDPFTPEEIMSRSDDELAEDALAIRRMSIYKRLEKDKWAAIRDEAKKWRNVEHHILGPLLEALRGSKPAQPRKLLLNKAADPFCAVIGLTDLHFGKYGEPGTSGNTYNREECRRRLFESTDKVMSQVVRYGRPDRLIVPLGSDFLHVDTAQGTTSSLRIKPDADGVPSELLVEGCELMAEWLQTLRTVAPLELVLMSGNHDRLTGVAVMLYLQALFSEADDVEVRRDRAARVYTRYGKNLIGFAHGDMVKKSEKLAGHMAREAAADWSECPYRTIYTGHLHHERAETVETFGIIRRQLPSLSGHDKWHNEHGFTDGIPRLQVFLHDYENGVGAMFSALP